MPTLRSLKKFLPSKPLHERSYNLTLGIAEGDGATQKLELENVHFGTIDFGAAQGSDPLGMTLNFKYMNIKVNGKYIFGKIETTVAPVRNPGGR
jgi:hypothetical protein